MPGKVVVVDDESMIRDLVKRALLSESVNVVTFGNGADALEYVRSNRVDLVITDIVMPQMYGTVLCGEIKAVDPFVQVVLMTAYPRLEDISAMLEAGAADFLIKPFEMDTFKQVIHEVFSRIERWKDLRKIWLEGTHKAEVL